MFILTRSLRAKIARQASEQSCHSTSQTSSRTVSESHLTSGISQSSGECHWRSIAIIDQQPPTEKCSQQHSVHCPSAPCPLCFLSSQPHRRKPASRLNIALCPCQLDFKSNLVLYPSCSARPIQRVASQLRRRGQGSRSQFSVVSIMLFRNIITTYFLNKNHIRTETLFGLVQIFG